MMCMKCLLIASVFTISLKITMYSLTFTSALQALQPVSMWVYDWLCAGGAVQRPVGAGVAPRGVGVVTAAERQTLQLAVSPRQGRVQALPLPRHRGHPRHRPQAPLRAARRVQRQGASALVVLSSSSSLATPRSIGISCCWCQAFLLECQCLVKHIDCTNNHREIFMVSYSKVLFTVVALIDKIFLSKTRTDTWYEQSILQPNDMLLLKRVEKFPW